MLHLTNCRRKGIYYTERVMNDYYRKRLFLFGAVSLVFFFLTFVYILSGKYSSLSNTSFFFEMNSIDQNASVEIASCTEGENWTGNFTFDTERSVDGNTGINFFSQYPNSQEITLNKRVSLNNSNELHLLVYADNQTVADQIDTFSLSIQNEQDSKSSFVVPPLHPGWNRVSIPISSSQAISSIIFQLTAQKNQTVQITLDRVWAEKRKSPYLSKIKALMPQFISAKTVGNRSYLHVFSQGINTLFFPDSPKVKNMTATFLAVPLGKGSIGFMLSPKNNKQSEYIFSLNYENRWKLEQTPHTKNVFVASGKLNELYTIQSPLWIRFTKKANRTTIYYSANGSDFETVTEQKIQNLSEFDFGIFSRGPFLLDQLHIDN